MRLPVLALLVLAGLPLSARAQEAVSCAPLLSAAEVQSTCGVPDAIVESTDGSKSCQVTARRPNSASLLTVVASVQETAGAAAATVEAARLMGRAADASRAEGEPGGSDDSDAALGQVLDVLGLGDPEAEAADDVSDEDAASRDLAALGDGGVRYVVDATAGVGLVTPTVVFSSGATVVRLESAVIAGRAGLCTVDALETLAGLVAGRL